MTWHRAGKFGRSTARFPPTSLLDVETSLQFVGDASDFLAAAGEHLALDPVVNTVVATFAERTVRAMAEWPCPARGGLVAGGPRRIRRGGGGGHAHRTVRAAAGSTCCRCRSMRPGGCPMCCMSAANRCWR